jgi:hypothetical protein
MRAMAFAQSGDLVVLQMMDVPVPALDMTPQFPLN